MRAVLATLVAATLSACAPGRPAHSLPQSTCKNTLTPTVIHGARGVILPSLVTRRALLLRRKDIEGYWYPSEDDVVDVESGLRDAVSERLTQATNQPPSAGRDHDVAALEHIVLHLGEYLRQYAGVVVDGSRRVLVNAFPEDTYCWRDDYISIEDGGSWFWSIQYDPKLHQFLHWELAGK